MKKTAFKKPVFPFIVDVRDYVTFSTIIKKDQVESGISSKHLILVEHEESIVQINTFNLFAHILEG